MKYIPSEEARIIIAPPVSSDATVINGKKLVKGPSRLLEALLPSSNLARVNMLEWREKGDATV